MNNKDIPADKINNEVARALGVLYAENIVFVRSKTLTEYLTFDPLTNHNKFHEIWTPEMEAKANRILDRWLSKYSIDESRPMMMDAVVCTARYTVSEYQHNSEYQSNRRLWQLRAICEVRENEKNKDYHRGDE